MIRRKSGGFTLVELLTTVGVIALLAALLAPVYVNAKKSAVRTACQSNLAQISKAFESYTADHGGCYPNLNSKCLWMGRYWRWPLRQYVAYRARYDADDPRAEKQTTRVWNSVLRCPADPVPGDVYDGTSYAYSAAFFHTPEQINSTTLAQLYDGNEVEFATVKTSVVVTPPKKVLVADWLTHTEDRATWWSWSGARNYAFADGHVAYLNARRIRPAVDSFPDINLTRDGVAGRDVE